MIISATPLVCKDIMLTPIPTNVLFAPSTASAAILQEIVSPATILLTSEYSIKHQKGVFL